MHKTRSVPLRAELASSWDRQGPRSACGAYRTPCGKTARKWPRNRVLARNRSEIGARPPGRFARPGVSARLDGERGPAGPRSVPERGFVSIFGARACMKGRGSTFEGKKVVRRSSLVRVRKGEEPLLGLGGAIGRRDRTLEGLPCRPAGRLPLLPAQGAAGARWRARQGACRALAGCESSQVCRGHPLFRMRAVRGARPGAAGRARVLY